MVRIRERFCAFVILTALCCLTSCSGIPGDTRDLLQAPKATGDVGEIQRALFDYAGGGISLRYPHNGENRTAFLLTDLDGDGTEEAVAFYAVVASSDEEMDVVHVNIIDRVDGEWRSVFDAETLGSAIDKVAVADLSGDGKQTLLIGAQLFGAAGNQLNLYTYDGRTASLRAQENYTQFLVGDLMGRGSDQLILLSLDGTEHVSSVAVYTFDGVTVERQGAVATDGNVSGYTQALLGKLPDGRPALFLDAAKSALSLVTDVVFFHERELVSPFYDPTVGETQLTLRNSAEVCRDVDDDGMIEIPSTELLPGYGERSEAERIYLTVWRRFDGSRFSDVMCADTFAAGGFRLIFPDRWRGNVTLVTDNANRMRSYRLYDEERQTAGTEILRLRAYDVDVYERFDHTELIELARDENTVWAARLVTTEGPYAVTEDELMTLFSVL